MDPSHEAAATAAPAAAVTPAAPANADLVARIDKLETDLAELREEVRRLREG